MMTTTAHEQAVSTTTIAPPPQKMPWVTLVLLTAMGFLLVAAETMPAGLLPVMAADLDTSEGTIGQFISVWALGTVIVTIPAINLTRRMRRKPLLLCAISGLIVANTVTAVSSNIPLSLASRFVAGASTGVLWGILAVYGRRISPPQRGGLALSIVSGGAPIGFALGTPLGAWIGNTFDWRWSFGGISALSVVVFTLIALFAPDAASHPSKTRVPLRRVFLMPGVAIVLAVIAAWMLAHNTIYTYIAPYLRATGTGLRADLVLLVYGIASIVGVVLTAALIDRYPRKLLHSSAALFVVAATVLILGSSSPVMVLGAAAMWGVTFGGAAAQLQSALSIAGRENSDVANSFLPVAFNIAIFTAGIIGAVLLDNFSALVLAMLMAALGTVAFLLTLYGRRTAFTDPR